MIIYRPVGDLLILITHHWTDSGLLKKDFDFFGEPGWSYTDVWFHRHFGVVAEYLWGMECN